MWAGMPACLSLLLARARYASNAARVLFYATSRHGISMKVEYVVSACCGGVDARVLRPP